MALIIEDGSEVAGANSYVTVAELDAFALLRNITSLPTEEAEKEALLILAMDFIAGKEDQFQGSRNTNTQPLAFPRTGVVLYDFDVPSDAIPQLLKDAQMQLAIDSNTTELQPTGAGREVIKEKVGDIEVQYSSNDDPNVQPVFTKAEAYLEPLYEQGGAGGASLTTIRI